MNTLTTLDLKAIDLPTFMSSAHRQFIGVDRFMDRMMDNLNSNEAGYPPYNVVKLDDDNFVVELAIAGFSKDSINITVHDGVLGIDGSQETDDNDTEVTNYLYKGIGTRKFRRTFTLSDYVEVKDATVKDGILEVTLERHVPEELKPREIPVNFK